MDDLEKPFAEKIKEAQTKAGSIPAEQFATEVINMIQTKLCEVAGLDPKEVLK